MNERKRKGRGCAPRVRTGIRSLFEWRPERAAVCGVVRDLGGPATVLREFPQNNPGLWLAACLLALVTVICTRAVAQGAPAGSATGACTLVINIDGFRNASGAAGGTIFSSPDGWPEDNAKAYRLGHTSIDGNHATLRFDNLPAGRYAVAVIHDENSNQRLDRNFLRVPKEGFGFANNPHVGLAAPSFDSAATNVTCPQTVIGIHLIYK